MPIIVTFALFILYTRYNLKSALRFIVIYRGAPQYLVDCCVCTSYMYVSSRQRLRSANRRQLVVHDTAAASSFSMIILFRAVWLVNHDVIMLSPNHQ